MTRLIHKYPPSLPGLVLLMLAFSLLPRGTPAQPGADEWIHKDTLHIASEPDYPPYCIVNENGEADGFSVDLIRAAAKATGMEVEVRIGLWDHIKTSLAEGKIDALPLVGRTPEREALFEFTMPYLSLHGAAFIRKSDHSIRSLEALKEKDILVMKGDNAEEYVHREGYKGKIISTHTYEEAFRRLSSGEADAVVAQQIMGLKLLDELGIDNVTTLRLDQPLYRQEFCFAATKGNEALVERLNEGLSLVIASDVYEEIRNKWFGPPSLPIPLIRQGKRLLPYAIALMIVLALLYNYYLRKQLNRHTRQLRAEVAEHRMTLKELRKQELLAREKGEEIRLLLDSTAEGIFGMDMDGRCTFLNRAARQMLGIPAESEILGKEMHDLVHHSLANGSAHPPDDCIVLSALNRQTGSFSEEDVFWTIEGSAFPVELFSYPIIREGTIRGAVVTFLDISERKKSEEALWEIRLNLEKEVNTRTRELNEQVEKLDRSQRAMLFMVEDLNRITSELKEERRKLELSNSELEAFTYSVSHDLRAPLRAINGYAKFLLEDYAEKLDEEGKRFIHTICDNASRMDQLIGDLLNLSRINRTEIKLNEANMDEIVRSAYAEIATETEQQDFILRLHPLPRVACDHPLIKQVWLNLFSNALKYSSRSERKEIVINGRSEEGKTVFSIRDYGCGFDPKYTHKVFGVFQRLHKTEEYDGTGVGLAIVERIIRRHQGEVWAEGKPGEGALISFSLPSTKSKTHR